jgi:hypothetical protein
MKKPEKTYTQRFLRFEVSVPVEVALPADVAFEATPEQIAAVVQEVCADYSDGRHHYDVEMLMDAARSVVQSGVHRAIGNAVYARYGNKKINERNRVEARQLKEVNVRARNNAEDDLRCSFAGETRFDFPIKFRRL